MNTKSDWQRVNRELMEQQRGELGAPPTAEEMLSYMRGELSPEQEERMRELLVCYPELTRGLTEPFPKEDAGPGEPGYVSDETMARRWTSLQSRIRHRRGRGRRLGFSHVATAMAATVLLLFGAGLWRAQMRATQPRIVTAEDEVSVPLMPLTKEDGKRGPGSSMEVVENSGQPVLLLVPVDQPTSDEYRITIMRDDRPDDGWESGKLRLGGENAFRIFVPAGYLQSGGHHVVLRRVDGADDTLVARYPIHVR
jgi:hypothetical protein